MSLRRVATFSKMAAATSAAARSKTRRAATAVRHANAVRYSGYIGEKEFREAIAIALNYLGKQYQTEVDPKYVIPTVDDFLKFMAHTKASLTPASSHKTRALSKAFQGPAAVSAAARRQEGGGIFEAIMTLLVFAFGGNLTTLVGGRTPTHRLMNILTFFLYAFMLRDAIKAIEDDPYPMTFPHIWERAMTGLYTPSMSDPLRFALFRTLPAPMAAYYDILFEQYSQVYTNTYLFMLPLNLEPGAMSHTGLLLGTEVASHVSGTDNLYVLAKAIKLAITNTQIFNVTFALPVAHGLRALRVPGADVYLRELVEKIRKPVAWLLPPASAGATGAGR